MFVKVDKIKKIYEQCKDCQTKIDTMNQKMSESNKELNKSNQLAVSNPLLQSSL